MFLMETTISRFIARGLRPIAILCISLNIICGSFIGQKSVLCVDIMEQTY